MFQQACECSVLKNSEKLWTLIVCDNVRAQHARRARSAKPLPGGVQGPALGPLVGSRGNAPVGVQGAKPPEAPGF